MHLASTDICRNQAFSLVCHSRAFQLHPEVCAWGFERWLIGHACEIAATAGVTVIGLRADTAQLASIARTKGQQVLRNWLVQLPWTD